MIYLIGCTKGGVGKTSVATNVAGFLALEGRRVCLCDADEQTHANTWANDRLELGELVPRVDCRVMRGSIRTQLATLRGQCEDLVIDAGGYDSQELRSAMRITDVIVMPFAAGQFQMYAAEKMHKMLAEAREFNDALQAVAFINMAETNWVRTKRAKAALSFIRDLGSMHCAESLLHLRAASFLDSNETGRSLFELPGKGAAKAADELAALVHEVWSLIGGPKHVVQAS